MSWDQHNVFYILQEQKKQMEDNLTSGAGRAGFTTVAFLTWKSRTPTISRTTLDAFKPHNIMITLTAVCTRYADLLKSTGTCVMLQQAGYIITAVCLKVCLRQ